MATNTIRLPSKGSVLYAWIQNLEMVVQIPWHLPLATVCQGHTSLMFCRSDQDIHYSISSPVPALSHDRKRWARLHLASKCGWPSRCHRILPVSDILRNRWISSRLGTEIISISGFTFLISSHLTARCNVKPLDCDACVMLIDRFEVSVIAEQWRHWPQKIRNGCCRLSKDPAECASVEQHYEMRCPHHLRETLDAAVFVSAGLEEIWFEPSRWSCYTDPRLLHFVAVSKIYESKPK